MLSFYGLDVLDEIWDLLQSVSKGCLAYSPKQHFYEVSMKLALKQIIYVFLFLALAAILFIGAELF